MVDIIIMGEPEIKTGKLNHNNVCVDLSLGVSVKPIQKEYIYFYKNYKGEGGVS